MKEIPLRHGGFTLVDDQDYEYLSQFKWRISPRGYVDRPTKREDGRRTTILIHREIMDAPKGMYVDHINHDKLDNRRSNLRVCTPVQNQGNRRKLKACSSKYKGVAKYRNGYKATIIHHRQSIFLGVHKEERAAALAYNNMALKLKGEYALLNQIS